MHIFALSIAFFRYLERIYLSIFWVALIIIEELIIQYERLFLKIPGAITPKYDKTITQKYDIIIRQSISRVLRNYDGFLNIRYQHSKKYNSKAIIFHIFRD